MVLVRVSRAGTSSPEARAGSAAGVLVTCLATSMKPRSRSMGMGKNVVELFSDAISLTVCK